MANKIICIAREFGSGGHEIAVRAASKLGIKVYEKDLFHLACKYGELSEKMMESADETAPNPYLFRTVHEGNYHVTETLFFFIFDYGTEVHALHLKLRSQTRLRRQIRLPTWLPHRKYQVLIRQILHRAQR